ncbi:hypothetical protein O181_057300 [Austropuccinia psidii MF-1]|uniref:Uncharacterized protein n=1 Tax=Austropuccinia psidii MF-1 TaxID=1389203 RepID=A0A9Q3HWW3_9BASI|nr:hypothetical protein [Austropuccinia psidii MF-1]
MQTFEALMALASKQTEASQTAFAKENQLRQAREKAKKLEEERKEKERLRLEKERLAKQRLEDQKREERLFAERQKRQAERGLAAEAARKQEELNYPSSSRPAGQPSSSRSRPFAHSPGSAPPLVCKDPEQLRRLEREEKQARAKARLFGEPVSAHKKPLPSRSAPKAGLRKAGINKSKPLINPSRLSGPSKPIPGPSAMITARQRIEQQFAIGERKPLNQVKRDRRTIDEIERDMKRRKAATASGSVSGSQEQISKDVFYDPRSAPKKVIVPPKTNPAGSISSSRPHQRTLSHPNSSTQQKTIRPSTSQPYKSLTNAKGLSRAASADRLFPTPASIPKLSKTQAPHSNRNRPYNNDDDDDEDDEDEDEAFEEEMVAPSIRDEIWKIMGKDRQKYAAKTIYSDEGSDDMEADLDDVLEEEGRAARLARLEDQKEDEALRRHELEKRKRLSQIRS